MLWIASRCNILVRSGIGIRITGLSRIWMSAASLSKSRGFITSSASIIWPSLVKKSAGHCMRMLINLLKSPIPNGEENGAVIRNPYPWLEHQQELIGSSNWEAQSQQHSMKLAEYFCHNLVHRMTHRQRDMAAAATLYVGKCDIWSWDICLQLRGLICVKCLTHDVISYSNRNNFTITTRNQYASPPRQCNTGRPCTESLEQFFQNFVSLWNS